MTTTTPRRRRKLAAPAPAAPAPSPSAPDWVVARVRQLQQWRPPAECLPVPLRLVPPTPKQLDPPMIDPEDMAERRRELDRRPARRPTTETEVPTFAREQTDQLLARMRDGDELHQAFRWLYVARSDRRPGTLAELQQVLEQIALDDGATVEQVRAGIASALEVEGRSLAEWEASLRTRRSPVLGRRQPRGIAS